ncbi:hypothetical protein [Actinomarinicola tropica]|uniref:Uncharacterized protein n=1 Tax=Actinomarinicola tropica TaxID=2789776 RepID=A0A5Q2RET6_9ACTN|nr:hypothetical protein [Actinomarinicola tropica]QGG95329.1 hypothetical protein GH723_09590 [Actinomarinicola tropica]
MPVAVGHATPTHEMWSRLRRPFDTPEVVDAALGLSEEVIDQLIGSRLASGDGAERLLARMPVISRALSTAIQKRPERCSGELRGPVLWSETMAARGASYAAEDVFVCAVPRRHYDTDENRILVAALVAIRDAGRATDALPADAYDDEVLRLARANGQKADRWLHTQHLITVPRTRPTPREIRRVRAGSRKGTYTPAVRVLEEALEPLTVDDLLPYCDRRTRAQHAVLVGLAARLEARGQRVPHLRARDGVLRAGPLEYRHPRLRGANAGLHGILLGDVLVDVPPAGAMARRDVVVDSLRSRAEGRRVVAVFDDDDLDRAVELWAGPPAVP